jgi:hypothetical protein
VRNSKFGCKSYELLYFPYVKFIFLVIFEELLDATMWLKLPKGRKVGYQKKVCVIHKILYFLFFLHIVLHDVIFNITAWI